MKVSEAPDAGPAEAPVARQQPEHVILLTDRYAPEARSSAYLFQGLAEALAAGGWRVTVVTKVPTAFVPEGAAAPQRMLSSVRVVRVSGIATMASSLAVRALDQALVAVKMALAVWKLPRPGAVLVYSPPLPLAVMAALHRRLRGVPYVIHLHDLYPKTAVDLGVLRNRALIRLAQALERTAYRWASGIVVPFERSRKTLIEENGVPAEKVHLVPNWVNSDACLTGPRENGFRRRQGLNGRFVVLYAGLMGLAQDLNVVVECARRMAERGETVFVLIGDGPAAARWKGAARGLPNVLFLEPVANDAYYEAVQASDVCLVPLAARLQSPAIPGKVQTIMAAGRPVVALVPPWNDTIGLIRSANCGIVITSYDPAELEQALETLRHSPTRLQELGSNGLRYAREHFSLASAVEKFQRALGNALNT